MGQAQATDLRAMQGLHPVADRGHHALDLVVLAFGQREPQMMLGHPFGGGGLHRFGVVVEHHAGEQLLQLLLVECVLEGHFVHLGHMVPG